MRWWAIDPYRDVAAYYDLEHDALTSDIDFYRNMMLPEPVLEIGVGTGRVMAALEADGLEVWGVDPSAAMLERARRRLPPSSTERLVQGTLSDIPPHLRFGSIILPLNTLWHLPTMDAQVGVLAGTRGRIRPDGTLIVDLSNPLALRERGARGEVRERFRGEYGAHPLAAYSTAWDDEAEQLLDLNLVYDLLHEDGSLNRRGTVFRFRYIYRWELSLMLRLAGYAEVQVYGSYDFDPYGTDSPNILIVAAPD